jgi:hypothetical protein
MPPGKKRKRASPAASPGRTRSKPIDDEENDPRVLVPCVEGERMPKVFAKQREEGLLLDATLMVGGVRITAHKTILIACSPFLKGLFTSGLAESSGASSGPVEIRDVDGAAAAACVDCMYTGVIALTGATVCHVIRAANLLQLPAMEGVACEFFVRRLEPSTALDALGFAEGMAAGGAHGQELRSQCMAYVHEHFTECAATPTFVDLPASSVAMIDSDKLRVSSEEVVLSALRRWYEHDTEGRSAALEELVPLVRFPLLPGEAKLQLPTELLLEALIKQGSSTPMKLLVELTPEYKASTAAVRCPRLKRRTGSPRVFTFASVHNSNVNSGGEASGQFDEAGVLHHIATEGGKSAYINPHDAGRVVVSVPNGSDAEEAGSFVQGPLEADSCRTANEPNSWIAVDLGTRRQLVVNHYALRGGTYSRSWSLRNWELQGSENGTSSWTTLRRHDDERTLEATPIQYPVAHWAVEGVTTPYRHFRILQHGLNSGAPGTAGDNELWCSGIELYGTLTEEHTNFFMLDQRL